MKQIQELKNKKTIQKANNCYSEMERALKMVAKGFLVSAYIQGEGGIGKTKNTVLCLQSCGLVMNDEPLTKPYFVVCRGKMTFVELYKFLHNHRNAKVIVFDDMGELIRVRKSIDLLKQATDTTLDERSVSYRSPSRELVDFPESFKINANLVFLFNSIDRNKFVDVKALFDRGKYVKVNLSNEDMILMMMKIAKTKWEIEVTQFLIKEYQAFSLQSFNLRLQQKSFQIYKFAISEGLDWKEELKNDFAKSGMSEHQRKLYEFQGKEWVKQVSFAKYLMTSQMWSYSTAKRFIADAISLEEYETDGKQKQRTIKIKQN